MVLNVMLNETLVFFQFGINLPHTKLSFQSRINLLRCGSEANDKP